MLKKKLLALLPLTAVMVSALSSCGGGGSATTTPKPGSTSTPTSGSQTVDSSKAPVGEQDLYICVYDGGYGTSWIEEMAADYSKKTGVNVHAVADQSVLDKIQDQLRNGSDYDIFMSHDLNWREYAAQGWLANLDDLYSRTIEGTNETFEQRLVDGAAEISKEYGKNEKEEHYYKSCYTQGAGGLVYNMDMFEEHGWKVPTTYAELVTLCQTIVDAKIDAGQRRTVAPFAWSGTDRQYYWDYLVFEWWAQLAGLDKINTIRDYKGPTGKYSDGYEMFNPATYSKEFVEAYEMWYNLVAMKPENSVPNAYGLRLIEAQSAFVTGQAAMIPYAQWAKYEITNSASDGKLNFDIAMMETPKAKADSQSVNYLVGFGDSIIVPSNSPSIDLAKDFIAYMATEEACQTFVREAAGAFLAFDYDDIDLSEIEAEDTYIKSIHEKLNNSQNFSLTSTNPIVDWNSNAVMPWITNVYYYATACQTPANYNPTTVGNTRFNTAKNGWSVWLSNAGLRD